jgi:hypothetical protein
MMGVACNEARCLPSVSCDTYRVHICNRSIIRLYKRRWRENTMQIAVSRGPMLLVALQKPTELQALQSPVGHARTLELDVENLHGRNGARAERADDGRQAVSDRSDRVLQRCLHSS